MTTINTVTELKQRLAQKNPQDVLLDVRTPQEFAQGHIPEAVNFDISRPDAVQRLSELDKSKTYITFCRSGGRSSMAAMIMNQQGFEVVNSKVGFMHWQGSGEAVAK